MFQPKTYRSGYLKVTNGHELYYEACGNPKGIPVLFVHGGPGGGFSDHDKVYFNPKKYNIIFFDQRGAGRSKPFASLKNNKTQDLVEDINRLLDFLELKKVFLFGGSWGSTLSLVYGIQNPKRLSGMMLRGIFLSTQKECDFYLKGGGAKTFFPEAWERFCRIVPKRFHNDPARYYLKQMQSKNEKVSDRYAYEYAYYELSMYKLFMSDKDIRAFLKVFDYRAMGTIECYYVNHRCFLEDDYILKNVSKISHLPISIVHGRYDVLVPPRCAYELHKKLKKSKLQMVTAGHASSEPEIFKVLISEMKRFEKIL